MTTDLLQLMCVLTCFEGFWAWRSKLATVALERFPKSQLEWVTQWWEQECLDKILIPFSRGKSLLKLSWSFMIKLRGLERMLQNIGVWKGQNAFCPPLMFPLCKRSIVITWLTFQPNFYQVVQGVIWLLNWGETRNPFIFTYLSLYN